MDDRLKKVLFILSKKNAPSPPPCPLGSDGPCSPSNQHDNGDRIESKLNLPRPKLRALFSSSKLSGGYSLVARLFVIVVVVYVKNLFGLDSFLAHNGVKSFLKE